MLAERHSLGTKKVTDWSLLFLNLFNLKNKVVNWQFTKNKTITIGKRLLRADPCCRSVCYKRICSCFQLCVYRVMAALEIIGGPRSSSLLLFFDLDLIRHNVLHHYLKITIWSSSTRTVMVSIQGSRGFHMSDTFIQTVCRRYYPMFNNHCQYLFWRSTSQIFIQFGFSNFSFTPGKRYPSKM